MGICYSDSKLKYQNSSIEFFDFKGQEFNAKIVDVYDGDTCHVVIKYNNKYIKLKIRCNGYDCPEMKPSKNEKNRDKEIEDAKKARNYFVSKVTNSNIDLNKDYSKKEIKEIINQNTKIVKLKCLGWDKYGRVLAEIHANNLNINQDMVNKNYGYSYDGGTKQTNYN